MSKNPKYNPDIYDYENDEEVADSYLAHCRKRDAKVGDLRKGPITHDGRTEYEAEFRRYVESKRKHASERSL